MGPKTNPTINKKLSVLFCFETRALFTMPLTPANRPLPTKNNITAKPIIMPPAKAEKGVKFMTFISFIYSFIVCNLKENNVKTMQFKY